MKIAIYGYGNLAKGVEAAVKHNDDINLYGIFTRRAPESIKTQTGVPVYPAKDILNHKGEFDVLILCGGSAKDLPKDTPMLAEHFNVVDSFDTHAKIPEHFDAVEQSAIKGGHTALISAGWDPGLFSIARAYGEAVLPCGVGYTFWGKGISQGHSDAIRKIDGVLDARQYTIPVEDALNSVRNGNTPELSTREKHRRDCYVVAKDGANKAKIEAEIKNMPNYFADYDTTVTFITLEELMSEHGGMPHGGSVIRNGKSGIANENTNTVEFSLKLGSNPEFTGSVLVAYARAVNKLSLRNEYGAKTVFDITLSDLSALSPSELRKKML